MNKPILSWTRTARNRLSLARGREVLFRVDQCFDFDEEEYWNVTCMTTSQWCAEFVRVEDAKAYCEVTARLMA